MTTPITHPAMISTDELLSSLLLCGWAAAVLDTAGVIIEDTTGVDVVMLLSFWGTEGSVSVTVDVIDAVTTVTIVSEVMVVPLVDSSEVVAVTKTQNNFSYMQHSYVSAVLK